MGSPRDPARKYYESRGDAARARGVQSHYAESKRVSTLSLRDPCNNKLCTDLRDSHIVEIFPHQHPRNITSPPPQTNGQLEQANGTLNGDASHSEVQGQSYHDILLSMIPGDKSKRSIRIYPSSRPSSSSKDAPSVKSKGSNSRLNGNVSSAREKAAGVYVKLDVDLP
jgi:hypothetical protein